MPNVKAILLKYEFAHFQTKYSLENILPKKASTVKCKMKYFKFSCFV